MKIVGVLNQCKKMMANDTLKSQIQKKFTLSNFKESVAEYEQNMSGGKFLLCPQQLDEALVDGAEFPEFEI